MVVETCQRLAPLAKDEELILVISREHEEETRRLFSGRAVRILSEPVGRNTAPCMALGALYAAHSGEEGPIAFLPADHFIADRDAFLQTLHRAASIAVSGAIVTLGIVPTRPETGYGYIRRGQGQVEAGGGAAYPVSAFVEKPDHEKAMQYLASGEYFWNAGIFVATAETILAQTREHLPDLYSGLERLKGKIGTGAFESEIGEVYPGLQSASFDYGIMEKATCPLVVVPCECGWSDVGSWDSLHALRGEEQDAKGNLSEGDSLLIDCEGSYVSSKGGKLIACLGLKNCLVVETPNAILVADLGRSQEVRKITDALKKAKREDLL
jgi:mannose-1-phosphate guanylyltransferase